MVPHAAADLLHQHTTPLESVDLSDPAWFAAGPPHALFARMRAEAPVHRNHSAHGPDFWSVTRAEDIVAASKRPARFSSYQGGIWLHPDAAGPLDLMRNLIIFKDPPEHVKYRAIVQAAFTPATIARLEETVREQVGAALDTAAAVGRMDVVAELAVPIPLRVIARLLGAPESDLGRLQDWTTRLDHAVADPSGTDGVAALGEMAAYFAELLPRQASDTDTLVSALYRAEVDGQRLTDAEIMMFFGILVFAGNDTTRNATSGGLLALTEHPEQLDLLADDPSRIPWAVEEILRWTTPLNYFARTATEDTELSGVPIPAGDRVVLWYASGSRDERTFPHPERFDVTRAPGNHLAFGGGGRHFCLGAPLARLELRVILEEVARRIQRPVLDGPVVPASSVWVNGLAALPVTFTPRDDARATQARPDCRARRPGTC
jgi:cytochrome P450